jgi:hypothetical protein
VEHDRWIEKITNALRSFRQAGWSVVAVGTAVAACTAGRDPRPEVNPENAIRSPSPDYMPAMGPAGLGGPQGHEDAGLPLIGPDGGIEPGKFGP